MKGRLGAAGKWDPPGAPGECLAEPARGQAPPGEGWAAGAGTALQGSCWGQRMFLQPFWGGPAKQVQRGLPKFAGGWTCPLAVDLI